MPSAAPRFDRVNDRRARDRYALSMPLRYRTAGEWMPGRSIDISAGGMMLDLTEDLETGTRVEILMDWPGVYFGKKKVRLFVIGSVVRAQRRGCAIRFLRHQFRDVAQRRPVAKVAPAAGAVTSGAAQNAPMGA